MSTSLMSTTLLALAGRRHPSPTPHNDALDKRVGDSVLLAQLPNCHLTGDVAPADLLNLQPRQLTRRWMHVLPTTVREAPSPVIITVGQALRVIMWATSVALRIAALGDHIRHVVFVRTQEQVVRPDAQAIGRVANGVVHVAGVQNADVRRDRPLGYLPGISVGTDAATTDMEHAIASPTWSSLPEPTSFGLPHRPPKAFFRMCLGWFRAPESRAGVATVLRFPNAPWGHKECATASLADDGGVCGRMGTHGESPIQIRCATLPAVKAVREHCCPHYTTTGESLSVQGAIA